MGNFVIKSLRQTLSQLSATVGTFLPRLLVMAVTIAVGGLVAWAVKIIVRRVLALIRFNSLVGTTAFTQSLSKAALPSPSELLASLIFWLVWFTFMIFGISALEIAALQEEIARFFVVLPQVFVASLILFVGILAANFVSRAILLAAVNANSPSPRLLSGFVRFIIITLVVTMALERIGLGKGVVVIAFSVFFAAIMLGLALAFGLGGKDLARRILERRFSEEKKEEEEGMSHL